ncbi:MAG: hypothetical protein M1522_01365 [Actinobacteria bacterium]|nr:hypothetical protein [Actinomycetota bacterium]
MEQLPGTRRIARHERVSVLVQYVHPLSRYCWWSRKAPIFRFAGRVRLREVTLYGKVIPYSLPSTMLHDSCQVSPASAPRFALALTVVC